MVMTTAEDARVRMLIAAHVRRLSTSGSLSSSDLLAGAKVDGQRIPIVNPQRGIFKPKQLRYLLSIRTVYPKIGARVWYDDQREVHAQIEAGEEVIDYAFQGSDPDAFDNQWLREAMQDQVPILYLLGVAPGRYSAQFPTFVVDWNPGALRAGIAFGAPITAAEAANVPDSAERKYALRTVRQRLHQARFREAVLTAYGNRCAITGLPEPRLLDAAHIIGDLQSKGQPVVPNGLPLSKVHHAAFDANLIGIDPDFRIHVSDALLSINDGPMFEQGVKLKHGEKIRLPSRTKDHPDQDRLAERFQHFQAQGH
ncbi:HNH endonuclease [Sphingomonas sp. LHG3406-1]|uniref:HNH endonuclease n=1 Tax=Sphingomonas sp. LHG3406-1 TaxID=2804617 RepID=UPI0026182B6C|nr:HNH endonuclease [Sphingomonas sp. LHG3406-1]